MTQRSNVGTVGNLVGSEFVVYAVASQEGNVDALMRADVDGRGGLSPGSCWVQNRNGFEAFELAEAGAADDGDVDGLCEIFSIANLEEMSCDVLSKVVGMSPIVAIVS